MDFGLLIALLSIVVIASNAFHVLISKDST